MNRDEQEIRQLVTTWMEATKKGDIQTVLSLMSEDVVWVGRLLDPHRLERRELLHPVDRLVHFPHLIGIDHHRALRADRLADDPQPAEIKLIEWHQIPQCWVFRCSGVQVFRVDKGRPCPS